MPPEPLVMVPAKASDRAQLARVRPSREVAHFVHWNHFWLDRAEADPAIRMYLLRAGARHALIGCIALGPHEPIDLDPSSRPPGIGEIYHIVIDRSRARRGFGRDAIRLALAELSRTLPGLRSVRLSHHPDNLAAARLYDRLGFVVVGEKVDGETGIRDVLRELRLPGVNA